MSNQPKTTNTSQQLTSYLYNYINIPSSVILKCSQCQNEQIQKHLQQQLGIGYYHMPDRYVDIYVCGFCKKLDQPKCQYCWQMKQCCGHRQKLLYKQYFAMVKKQLLNNITNLLKIVKKYDSKSTSPSLISQQSILSSSSLFNQLIITLNTIQQQLKQQIFQNIQKNNEKLLKIYKQYQQQLFTKIQPYTPQGIQRYRTQKNDKRAIRYIGLMQCQDMVKQIEGFRRLFQEEVYEISQRYIQRVGEQYPAMLFNKICQQFRKILTPNITYKSSLCQTVGTQHVVTNYSNNNNNNNNNNINTQQSQQQSYSILQIRIKQLQEQLSQSIKQINEKQLRIEQFSNKIQKLQQQNKKLNSLLEVMLQREDAMKCLIDKHNNRNKNQQKQDCSQQVLLKNVIHQSIKSVSQSLLLQDKKQTPSLTTTTTINTKSRKKSQSMIIKKSIITNQSQQMMNSSSWLQDVVNQIGQ